MKETIKQQKRPDLIEITVSHFNNIEERDKARAYRDKVGLKEFNSLDFQYQRIPAGVYHVETEHLFEDQYNILEGLRIFEWAEPLHQHHGCRPRPEGDYGYYISEGIEQLRQLQNDTKKCGYCGKNYYKTSEDFCLACLDSEYLSKDELHLLRLHKVSADRPKRAKLTENESNWLMPQYIEAQTVSKTSRAVARRLREIQSVKDDYKKTLEQAKIEHDGMLWLLERFINTGNCIFYGHRSIFSFGWKSELDYETMRELRNKLDKEGFPFEYEIKSKDLGTVKKLHALSEK